MAFLRTLRQKFHTYDIDMQCAVGGGVIGGFGGSIVAYNLVRHEHPNIIDGCSWFALYGPWGTAVGGAFGMMAGYMVPATMTAAKWTVLPSIPLFGIYWSAESAYQKWRTQKDLWEYQPHRCKCQCERKHPQWIVP